MIGATSRANYLLKWEAIRAFRAEGFASYDLWGIATGGIAQFKEGFGGRQVDYVGARDLPLRPAQDAALRLAAPRLRRRPARPPAPLRPPAGRQRRLGSRRVPTPNPYLDDSPAPDRLSGGVRMIPIQTPQGRVQGLDQARRQQPAHQAALPARRPGRDARVLRAVRQLPARGRHRVLLLRPARLVVQRPARRPGLWDLPRFVDEVEQVRVALGLDAATSTCSANRGAASSPWSTRCITRSAQGPGHLEHGVELPGLQRLRQQRADAGDGPGRARRDQGHGGARRHRQPALHGAAHGAALRPPRPAHAGRRVAGSGQARHGPHQPGHLREDAGPQRAGPERHARELGPHRRPAHDRGADAGHRRPPRHDGSGVHGDDGGAAAQRPLPRLSRTAATWRCSTTRRPT